MDDETMPDPMPKTGQPTTERRVNEARAHQRHSCEVPSSCRPVSSWSSADAKWSGTITNLSLGGFRIRLPRRFESGTSLAIELPGAEGEPPCTIFARVIHALAASDGWELGCQFVGELSEEELFRLLDTSALPATVSRHEPPGTPELPIAPS